MVARVEREGGRMERKRKLIPLDESQKGVSEMLFAESLPVNSRYDMKLSQIGALGDFIDTNTLLSWATRKGTMLRRRRHA